MTKHEAISRLLVLSTELEAEGKVMSALACSMAAAELMLHPARGAGDDIDRAVEEAETQINQVFDRFQVHVDRANRDFENIIRLAFPQHGEQL